MTIDISSQDLPVIEVVITQSPLIVGVITVPPTTVEVIGLPGPPGPPGPSSDQITVSDTPPSSPEINDLWVDTS